MNGLFGEMARWMSRRNGESLARAVAARLEGLTQESPHRSVLEVWGKVLESRPGWRRINPNLFEFKTGERLALKGDSSFKQILAQVTALEVKPLSRDFSPEVQRILIEEAVAAATRWWEKSGGMA